MRAVATPAVRALVLARADAIASRLPVSAEEILGRSRLAHVVHARHELMAALWQEGLSTTVIGLALGLDHTSVIYGCRKVLGDDYRIGAAERFIAKARASYRGKIRVAS